MISIAKALEAIRSQFTASHHVIANPSGHGSVLVHRDNMDVHTLKGPTRSKRCHKFTDVSTFAAWLNRHADPALAEILVDADKIVAGLEPKTDEFDRITCHLTVHPAAARWKTFLEKPQVTQRELHRFLLGSLGDFEDQVVDDENIGSYGAILAANLAMLEVIKHDTLAANLDERGFYSFGGQSSKAEVSGKIPTKFEIVIPWFRGVRDVEDDSPVEPALCAYTLEVLVSMDIDGSRPLFTLEAPTLPLLLDGARDDAVTWLENLLEAAFDDDGEPVEFLVGLGKFAVEPVELLTPGRGVIFGLNEDDEVAVVDRPRT